VFTVTKTAGRPAGFGNKHSDQIAFRADADLLSQLAPRTGRQDTSEHTIARRDLARYYTLLESVSLEISDAEFNLLCEVVATDDFRLLSAIVTAAPVDVQDGYGVNATEVGKRLEAMENLQLLALLDAIERYRIEYG
jgi:hypothetical protein